MPRRRQDTWRNTDESLSDRLFLLYLINKASEKGRLVTIPLHKFTFLSEYELSQKGVKGLNYPFYRERFGPASPAIYDDVGVLLNAELIQDAPFKSTKAGTSVLEDSKEFFEKNKTIKKAIDRTVRKYPLNTSEIKSIVYDMKITLPDGSESKVKDVPLEHRKILLLKKLSDDEAQERFWLSDSWSRTLEILFNPDKRRSIEKGLEAVRKGNVVEYQVPT